MRLHVLCESDYSVHLLYTSFRLPRNINQYMIRHACWCMLVLHSNIQNKSHDETVLYIDFSALIGLGINGSRSLRYQHSSDTNLNIVCSPRIIRWSPPFHKGHCTRTSSPTTNKLLTGLYNLLYQVSKGSTVFPHESARFSQLLIGGNSTTIYMYTCTSI